MMKKLNARGFEKGLDPNPQLKGRLTAESAETQLDGEVEVDGAYFGGHVRPANRKEDRVDRRKAENQTGKRQVVVIMRERSGETLPFVFKREGQAIATIASALRQTPSCTLTKPRRGTCSITSS